MSAANVSILIAGLSAFTAIYGYIYAKKKEREFELSKVRKELYEQFITLLIESSQIVSQLQKKPECQEISVESFYQYAFENSPEFVTNLEKTFKAKALLCIYGSDNAVKAAYAFQLHSAKFAQKMVETPPDLPGLILTFRKNIYAPESSFRDTKITKEEIAQLLTP
jgi:hypothetical protein